MILNPYNPFSEPSSYKFFEEVKRPKLEQINMNSFKERLTVEKIELKEKIDKLSAFLGSDNFKSIDKRQQGLLRQQLTVMLQYLEILQDRIDLLIK